MICHKLKLLFIKSCPPVWNVVLKVFLPVCLSLSVYHRYGCLVYLISHFENFFLGWRAYPKLLCYCVHTGPYRYLHSTWKNNCRGFYDIQGVRQLVNIHIFSCKFLSPISIGEILWLWGPYHECVYIQCFPAIIRTPSASIHRIYSYAPNSCFMPSIVVNKSTKFRLVPRTGSCSIRGRC